MFLSGHSFSFSCLNLCLCVVAIIVELGTYLSREIWFVFCFQPICLHYVILV